MEVITQQASCDVCDGSELIHDNVNGEIVCARCGLVRTDDLVSNGPEWRAFTLSESAKRERATPTPYSAFDGGMFTRFREGKDANGTRLKPEELQKWRRLRRFEVRLQDQVRRQQDPEPQPGHHRDREIHGQAPPAPGYQR
jgi:transcription initiation factor TFIIIB Brf1 subunit/transcription initiation factor TFIIB